jgi:hypothetical protein
VIAEVGIVVIVGAGVAVDVAVGLAVGDSFGGGRGGIASIGALPTRVSCILVSFILVSSILPVVSSCSYTSILHSSTVCLLLALSIQDNGILKRENRSFEIVL